MSACAGQDLSVLGSTLVDFPNALYVVDTDSAHDDGTGDADYVVDEVNGYHFLASNSAPNQHPLISTADIASHQTIQIVTGQLGFGLFSIAIADALTNATDFTLICRVKAANTATLQYISHSFAAAPVYSASPGGGSYFMQWTSTFSPSNRTRLVQRNNATQDNDDIAHTRDTNWHTLGLSGTGGAGGTLSVYIDGSLAGTGTRSANFPNQGAPNQLNNVGLGGNQGASPTRWKLWAGYAYNFSAADHLEAHGLVLAREL